MLISELRQQCGDLIKSHLGLIRFRENFRRNSDWLFRSVGEDEEIRATCQVICGLFKEYQKFKSGGFPLTSLANSTSLNNDYFGPSTLKKFTKHHAKSVTFTSKLSFFKFFFYRGGKFLLLDTTIDTCGTAINLKYSQATELSRKPIKLLSIFL